ncbi:MAG: ATP-dependent sacrificial sulfur transferase LarE [Pseudomonadota bacterium]
MDATSRKCDRLKSLIAADGPMAVAYSGGVDSTLLLAVARQVLGTRVIAITAHTPLMPEAEKRFAADTAAGLGANQVIVTPDVMGNAALVANPPHRCYICKKMVFADIIDLAAAEGFARLAHGANMDDLSDFRPGMQAAEELGVAAPLVTAGLGKKDIRRLSHEMGLPTWDRPAMACLASRIPYGTPITAAALAMIEQAEEALRSIGITHCRVRAHGNVARIEVASRELHRMVMPGTRERIVVQLREIGFDYVALDMEGYATGRMNRVISQTFGVR